jgi:hypothetical protein
MTGAFACRYASEVDHVYSYEPEQENCIEFHLQGLKDTTFEKYKTTVGILKKHFSTVTYREDPGGNWLTLVSALK